MHQDRPVKGWAISRADQEEDFASSGRHGRERRASRRTTSTISIAYEQADKRGLVVWAEIPLVNQVSFDGTPANAALTANARQQLIELIRQNYNHPSIAVWSIANEIDCRATQNDGPSRPRYLSATSTASQRGGPRPVRRPWPIAASGPNRRHRRAPG